MRKDNVSEMLFSSIDAAPLAVFRVLFGALMFWQAVLHFPFYAERYDPFSIHFTYPLFSWVRPWPGEGMFIHYLIMMAASLGIALGFYYRFSALLFFLSFTYVFLLDQTYYQNHYYLFSIISFLLIWVDADRRFSVAARINPAFRKSIPSWNVRLAQAQIILVYVYAGISKINADWLFRGEPMRSELLARAYIPHTEGWLREIAAGFLTPLFTREWFIHFITYGGVAFDLSIGALLLWPPTRWLGFGLVIFFHLMNKFLFGLETFSWVMIASLALFWPVKHSTSSLNISPSRKNITLAALGIYLVFQLLFPLRHWMIQGNPLWTEEASKFSWYMMAKEEKLENFACWVHSPSLKTPYRVDFTQDLLQRQFEVMVTNPQMLLQYAHYLKTKYQAWGIQNPVITCEVLMSMNGHPAQYLVDPSVDLASQEYPWYRHASWINDFKK